MPEPVPAALPAGTAGWFTTSSCPVDALRLPVVAWLDQVHGRDVVTVAHPPSQRRVGVADGLVTRLPSVALAVRVADCLPVLLADPVHRVVGAAHAGRAGLVAGVLAATVDAMTDLGADPADVQAVVGPAVCGQCYEVPAAMQAEVAAVVPGVLATTRRGSPALDLPAGAERVLTGLGVAAVRRTGICTVEDDRFPSYRRERTSERFAGVVMLTDDG